MSTRPSTTSCLVPSPTISNLENIPALSAGHGREGLDVGSSTLRVLDLFDTLLFDVVKGGRVTAAEKKIDGLERSTLGFGIEEVNRGQEGRIDDGEDLDCQRTSQEDRTSRLTM